MPRPNIIKEIHTLEIERFHRLCQLRRYEEACEVISYDDDLYDEEDRTNLEVYKNILLEKVAELRAEMNE